MASPGLSTVEPRVLWPTQSKTGKWFNYLIKGNTEAHKYVPLGGNHYPGMRGMGHHYGHCLQLRAFLSLCIVAPELLSLIRPVLYVPAAPEVLVWSHHSMAFHTSESLQRLFLCLEFSFFTFFLHHTAQIDLLFDTCPHQDGSVMPLIPPTN